MRNLLAAASIAQTISEVELHNAQHWLFHPIPIFSSFSAANTFSQSPCLNEYEYDSLPRYVFYSYLYIHQEFPQCQHKIVPSPTEKMNIFLFATHNLLRSLSPTSSPGLSHFP